MAARQRLLAIGRAEGVAGGRGEGGSRYWSNRNLTLRNYNANSAYTRTPTVNRRAIFFVLKPPASRGFARLSRAIKRVHAMWIP